MSPWVVVDTDVFTYLWQKTNDYEQYGRHLVGKVVLVTDPWVELVGFASGSPRSGG